jgi:hypothetical protein
MTGKGSRDKGMAFEREVVMRFEEMGIKAQKMPLSGAIPGFEGDVTIWPANHIDFKMKVECKRRARGFGTIYSAMQQGDPDMVVCRDDRKEEFYVVSRATMKLMMEKMGWTNE